MTAPTRRRYRWQAKRYQWQTMAATTLYVIVMLVAWPLIGTTNSVILKTLLALAPVVPMLYVIGLMALRIRDSDELEQRTHLIALGVATAVVGALSLAGGFLAIAKLLPLDGTVLIWVFPALMVSYGATRWWVARRYGMSLSCGDEGGMPKYVNLLLAGVLMALVALYAWWTHDAQAFGMFCGMAAVLAVGGTLLWLRARHARLHRAGKEQ